MSGSAEPDLSDSETARVDGRIRMRPMKQQGTPLWIWIVVIAAGIGLGLGLRPLFQGGFGGGSSNANQTPAIRCPGPEGSELALNEFIESGIGGASGADVTYTRTYRLERPGQVPLLFDGGAGDKDNTPINCANVQFGPGARVAFSRGRKVSVVELVGPTVRTWDATSDKDLTAIILEPRWKLGLRLEDYAASAPVIDEEGKTGRVTLNRTTPNPQFPSSFVFSTQNGGSSWVLNRVASLRGF
jgi:hypothetical protein